MAVLCSTFIEFNCKIDGDFAKNASDRIFCRYYSFIVYCANLRTFRDVVWAICEYMMMIIIGNSEYNNQVNI